MADLLGPLCQAEDVRQYGLTIQQSPTTPGAVRVSVNTGDTNLQREIPIPRPRPPTDDIQGL